MPRMTLRTDHLDRCLKTLCLSLTLIAQSAPGTTAYEVFRNAVIKGFELSLETSGKLLRKALKAYGATPKAIDELAFKDVFRHAAKHGIIAPEAVDRWFGYRDNRNVVAHDYGEKFAEITLRLMPGFLADAEALVATLASRSGGDDGA